jgi:hypothetical protein
MGIVLTRGFGKRIFDFHARLPETPAIKKLLEAKANKKIYLLHTGRFCIDNVCRDEIVDWLYILEKASHDVKWYKPYLQFIAGIPCEESEVKEIV